MVTTNQSENVLIENMTLAKATGDGVLLVAGGPAGSSVKNIIIRHNDMHDNRRQRVSVVGGKYVLIQDNEIHHINGVAPEFGVDIESLSYASSDIVIIGNRFHHNHGGDVVNTDGGNVWLQANQMQQGDAASSYIDGPLVYWTKTGMTILDNTITMLSPSANGRNGIVSYAKTGAMGPQTTTRVQRNTCNDCGFTIAEDGRLVVQNNRLKGGHLVFRNVGPLTLQGNDVSHPDKCWAYRFKHVTGRASGNLYNGAPIEIPLSDAPWDGCWLD